MRVAKRNDWQTIPMPPGCRLVPLEGAYSADEFARLAAGRIPQMMEHKWFIYYEAPWLYLHRSWTGFCLFKVRLEPTETGGRVTEAWANSGYFHRESDTHLAADDVRHTLFDSLELRALLDWQAGRSGESQWDHYFEALKTVSKEPGS